MNNGVACSNTDPLAGTQSLPFCGIQAAADVIGPGQTLDVAGPAPSSPYLYQDYYGSVVVSRSGTQAAPISIVMEPGAALQGTLTLTGANYTNLSGLLIYNRNEGDGISIEHSSNVTIDQSYVEMEMALQDEGSAPDGQTDLSIDGNSSFVTVSRSEIDATFGYGIQVEPGAKNITLTTNFVFEGNAAGIFADGASDVDVTSNTFDQQCGPDISLTDGTSASVENNVGGPERCPATTKTDPQPAPSPAQVVDTASAPSVTSDYNSFQALPGQSEYSWAGTAYSTAAELYTHTGQGAHDIDGAPGYWGGPGNDLAPTSPLTDSADANAPGELATDFNNHPRVDDPLIPNTGTGPGDFDRGAYETQDPIALSGLAGTPKTITASVPATFTAQWTNPWSDPLDGTTYAFTFGDHTSTTSSTGSAPHTYTQPGTYTVSAVATRNGVQLGSYSESYSVAPLPALSSAIGCTVTPAAPDATSCTFQPASDLPLTLNQVTFGDRTPAATPGADGTLPHTYAAPGSYTVTENITDSLGRTSTTTQTATVGPAFVPYGPYRVLDTRYGDGAAKRPVGPGGILRVKIAGTDGIPTSGLTAVTLNVTDTHATAPSWVTAYPDGSPRPNASNLNFAAGQTNPNLVTVPVGKDGYVDLWNANGHTDLFADVQGYYTTTPSTGNQSMSNLDWTTPTRVLDTRYGTGASKGPVAPGSTTTLTLPGATGTATTGAVLNITATGATSSGWIAVTCGGANTPTTSNLNYRAGQTTSNLVVTNVCTGGKVEIYNSGGHVNLFADVQGYYTNEFAGSPTQATGNATPGSPFVPTAPTRILDTRYGTGAPRQPIGPGGTIAVKVTGSHGVPTGAGAVLINLTGTAPSTSTYLTAFGGGTVPNASNIDLVRGETRPVLAVVPVDAGGYIHLHNAYGTVNVFADLEGYYI